MKFVSFRTPVGSSYGLYHNQRVLPLLDAAVGLKLGLALPPTLEDLIRDQDTHLPAIRKLDAALKQGDYSDLTVPYDSLGLLPPIQRPASCRDGYAFRQHVASARANRGVPMITEFDQYPIFYFTNHNSIVGPGPVNCLADHLDKLDFELECAVVIGRGGRNLTAAQIDSGDYIFGYTILNDFSARTLQMEEMALNLGPAKGKDWANAIGPLLVTPDELTAHETPAPAGHTGRRHNLSMTCRVNGTEVSRGNLGDMDWTFAEILERCAYGVDLHPTDLIGSGTVGTGCFLELNGTGKRIHGDSFTPQWLQVGDVVELEIDQLGTLRNTIAYEGDWSLLKLKKAEKS